VDGSCSTHDTRVTAYDGERVTPDATNAHTTGVWILTRVVNRREVGDDADARHRAAHSRPEKRTHWRHAHTHTHSLAATATTPT
jgi:hypothetical protein